MMINKNQSKMWGYILFLNIFSGSALTPEGKDIAGNKDVGKVLNYEAKDVPADEQLSVLKNGLLSRKKPINYGDYLKICNLGSSKGLRAPAGTVSAVDLKVTKKLVSKEAEEDVTYKHYFTSIHNSSGIQEMRTTKEKVRRDHYEYNLQSSSGVAAAAELPEYWVVKGPHRKDDPWNCIPGTPVMHGDIIRLQCADPAHNGNLHMDKQRRASSIPSNLAVALNGKDGLGDGGDNFQVLVEGGGQWIWGRNVTFVSVDAKCELYSASSEVMGAEALVRAQAVVQKDATTVQIEAIQAKATAQAEAAQKTAVTTAPAEPVAQALTSDQKSRLWWVFDAIESAMPEDDVAWTGAPYGSPAEDGANELVNIEIVKLGMGGGIAPKATQDFADTLSAAKKPRLSGFAKDQIDNFDSSFMLTVNSLLSKGAAWLGTSLDTPGKVTILFRAKAEDRGDIQVVFGFDVGIDFVWKVRLGAYDNTKSQIIKRRFEEGLPVDEVVFEITRDETPAASTTPGVFIPYWVSINDGLILVGAGSQPGVGTIMSWRDPNPPAQVRRVGFSTDKTPVTYAEVQMRKPVVMTAAKRVFDAGTTEVNTSGSLDNLTWYDKPFRVPGRGAVSFDVKGNKQAVFAIAAEKDGKSDRYLIIFGDGENEGLRIQRMSSDVSGGYKDMAFLKAKSYPKAALDPSGVRSYWASFYFGELIIGEGKLGEGAFTLLQDISPISTLKYIGFGGTGGTSASFKNIKVASPVRPEIATVSESYKRELAQFAYKGAVYIILPYEYHIEQEGSSVKFKDIVNNKTYYPGATPQQRAKYYFMITVKSDGFPQLDWVTEPENPSKIELQKSADIMKATSESLDASGQSVSGQTQIGGLIATIGSLGFSAAGAALGAGAAAQSAKLQNFRDAQAYVYTDKYMGAHLGEASIPPEAVENKAKVDANIELGSKWKPSTPDKFERLVSLYQQIVYLINHPYVVQNPYVKKSLFDALASLNEAQKELYPDPTQPGARAPYNDLLNLLISAQNNAYLIDMNKPDEAKLKDVWYSWINGLARALLADNARAGVELRPYYAEYVWLTDKLKETGKGSIVFEAKAINDIFICFGQTPFKTRNSSNEIYEIVIGGWDNTKTAIRVQSLDFPVAQFTSEEHPDAMITPIEYQKYWISLDNGTIALGKGDLGTNKVLEWTDPYPPGRMQYVGLSSWNTPINYRNIFVAPPYQQALKEGWKEPTSVAAAPVADPNAVAVDPNAAEASGDTSGMSADDLAHLATLLKNAS